MAPKIRYAVIALTKKDAEFIIKNSLINENEILSYLKDNYKAIYGESPDDWKPFKGINKSISEIITQNSPEKYCSDTEYVYEKLDTNLTELLSNIEVLFIDIFALYMDKYSQFSIKADYACDRGERHICCFMIDLISLSSVQSQLIEDKKAKIWSSVSYCHNKGRKGRCFNRVTYTITELCNFINYLQPSPRSQGEPSIKNYEPANKTLGSYDENPTAPPRF